MTATNTNPGNLEVQVLNQISHLLPRQKDVSMLLKEALDILYREMGLLRGTVTLLRGDELIIEASHGLTGEEVRRGRYRIGEGITGRVAKSGKPLVIPDISEEPEFLDRTRARGSESNIAFICVPVINDAQIIGTMSIDIKNTDSAELDRVLWLLETVSNILAGAVAAIAAERASREKLIEENQRLKLELGRHSQPDNIVGNCSSMKSVYAMVAQVAESTATVLIRGSSGTGKELVARAIHNASTRKNKNFVAVNCAALPENLIESELFGHEKGAFTGAMAMRKGRCEVADGGTIFLDEIGDISVQTQVKLLRFLQEKTFERVGGNEKITVDVRVLAATSRDLEELIEKGDFREDLYYRLNVFPIHLPDLKQRRSDILLLSEHFLSYYSAMYKRSIKRISTPAINMLMSYHWPGNVRELENCIERAVLTSTDEVIHGYNLPPSIQTGSATNTNLLTESSGADLAVMVATYEKEIIVEALKLCRGNVAAAARQLGSTPRILHYRLDKLGINPKSYK